MTDKLQRFADRVGALVSEGGDDSTLLRGVRDAMAMLVAADDWLPEAYTRPHPTFYQQYLLHRDPGQRFSVVSFVWGPGQSTPVHDHTVWGAIGMLRGAERATAYHLESGRLVPGATIELRPGDVELVGPSIGDIHRVTNAYDDRVSISIHCYGGDIGQIRRHVYDPDTGAVKDFVSGYANPSDGTP